MRADAAEDRAGVADGLDHVAGAGLALGADHGRALADAPQRLADAGGAADEGDREGVLVDVERLVGRGQDLGLVDEVDAERLQDLRLHEVPDAGLRHDRDRDLVDDRLDHVGVAHAGDAALHPDVGRDPLQRHHRGGARVLGDARLLAVDDVHDHAALEHLREAGLDLGGADELGAVLLGCRLRHVDPSSCPPGGHAPGGGVHRPPPGPSRPPHRRTPGASDPVAGSRFGAPARRGQSARVKAA
jgi:hypothetical protein